MNSEFEVLDLNSRGEDPEVVRKDETKWMAEEISKILAGYRSNMYDFIDDVMLQAFEEIGEVALAAQARTQAAGGTLRFSGGTSSLTATTLKKIAEHAREGTLPEYITGNENVALRLAFLNVTRMSIDEFRKKFPRSFQKWTDEEDQKLVERWKEGRGWAELSAEFQRNVNALKIRLNHLGYEVAGAKPHW